MAFSNQDIIAAYQQAMAGGASEADFVKEAQRLGVSNSQLAAAQQQLQAPVQAAPQDRFTQDQYSAANQWASGQNGETILSKAAELGLTPAELGKVFGRFGGTGDQVTSATGGYNGADGSWSGVAKNWTYDKDKGWSYSPTQTKQGVMGIGQRSEGQNPFAYDQKNPYMAQMANTIGMQIGDNLGRNILPTVRSGAQAVGGFGGSRQGVVEANVLNDASRELSNAITSMYYGDYNNAMNRQLQKYQTDSNFDLGLGQLALSNKSADNQYSLGLGQLALGNKTADNNFNLGQGQLTNQMDIARLNDATNRYQSDNALEGTRIGANASMANAATSANAATAASNNNYNLGMRNADINELGLANSMFSNTLAGLAGLGTGLYGVGTTQQNAPWNTLAQFTGSMSGFTPFGQTQQVGGGTTGMIGGAMAGAQIGKNFSGSSNPFQMVNTGSIQNTPQYLVSGF